jgi:DNA-directed RNA polymerase specialized sigma24 family protein
MLEVPGHSQTQVLAIIDRVAAKLAPNYYVGYFDRDDLAQECRCFALEALSRYDPRPGPDGKPTKPLENFLYKHTRNRLVNLRRDCYRRADYPCPLCKDATDYNTGHPDRRYCDRHVNWQRTQDRKAALMAGGGWQVLAEERQWDAGGEADPAGQAEVRDALRLIDAELDLDMRADYLRMRAGQLIDRDRRRAVEAAVREILAESGLVGGV